MFANQCHPLKINGNKTYGETPESIVFFLSGEKPYAFRRFKMKVFSSVGELNA